jgi:hypothetical protein
MDLRGETRDEEQSEWSSDDEAISARRHALHFEFPRRADSDD